MSCPGAISVQAVRAAAQAVPWPEDVEALFGRLARRRGCVWLDSAGGPAPLARWSVLTAEPSAVLVHQGDVTRLLEPSGRVLTEVRRNPFGALREALGRVRMDASPPAAAPPYGPGFYGYLAYDLAPYIEPKSGLAPTRDIALPDLWLGFYEAVLVLDHHERRAHVVGAPGPAWQTLLDALGAAAGRDRGDAAGPSDAGSPRTRRTGAGPAVGPVQCNLSRDAYLAAVARAREYIAAGDVFQVNLSRRFTVARDPAASAPADPALRPEGLYLRLRRSNPAPYAAYIGLGAGRAVLSSSPELFLDLRGGRVVTRPIKGTRPRRPDDEAFNRQVGDELLASAKDRAELVMIVDLERNDLGRVSSYGTVRVVEPRAMEAYASVFHTVAAIEGRLHTGRDVVDLLKATFPGGSVTGAPKVRAMQVIAELEPTRRSVYTGAIGYLAPPTADEPAGRCALSVAIRTLLAAGPNYYVQVGGGIVADSQPEAEFDETNDKARALLAALGLTP